MASSQSVGVTSSRAFEVTGPDTAIVTVLNTGPDSCYYATASTVSSGSNDGTLASGASLSFAPSKFFISSGTSRLLITIPTAAEASRQYDRDLGHAGLLTPQAPGWFVTITVAAVGSQAYFNRFVPSRNMNIGSIRFRVQTLGNDEAFSVGIHSGSLARLATSGALTSVSGGLVGGGLNTTGFKTATIPTTALKANAVYYAGFSVGPTPGALRLVMASAQASTLSQYFGTTAPDMETGTNAAAHPLPDPAAALAGVIETPILALLEA